MSSNAVETTNKKGEVLIRSWARDDRQSGAFGQAFNTVEAHGVIKPVALMPDAHVGKGACIGSVVATLGSIIPAAVGVDLGCGMSAVQLDLTPDQLPDNLQPVLSAFGKAVPSTNFDTRKKDNTTPAHESGYKWLAQTPAPSGLADMGRAAAQLGTLGGGNHFLELSEGTDGYMWIVVHSGSRGVGNWLARQHIKTAIQYDQTAQDKDLAALKEGTAEFKTYINDMLWAQEYAYKNREIMLHAAVSAFLRACSIPSGLGQILERIRCHHNYATREEHSGRNVWVTRKGAIRARKGDKGIIPGSMGTSTFIVNGLGSEASYCSAAHGAGRTMSRGQAKRTITREELLRAMHGRVWLEHKANSLIDEAPQSYKDIHTVMAAQDDLCEAVEELNALVNYKGT